MLVRMELHRNRRRAESFGELASAYDRHRPTYPSALFDWLGPGGTGTAVDVGTGTGQAARRLAERGWRVIGVEPDARMAAVATRYGLDVEVAHFEEWSPPPDGVDLVCCAQAWHWLDPARGVARAAELLRPGGRLAVWWNIYRYDKDVAAAIQAAYADHPDLLVDSVPLGTAELTTEGRFVIPPADLAHFAPSPPLVFRHDRRQSIEEWLAELETHSIHDELPQPAISQLLGEVRGRLELVAPAGITVTYHTVVAHALRLGAA